MQQARHQAREYRRLKKEIYVLQKEGKKGPKPTRRENPKKKEPKKLLAIVGQGGYNNKKDVASKVLETKESKEELEFDSELEKGTKVKVGYYLYQL